MRQVCNINNNLPIKIGCLSFFASALQNLRKRDKLDGRLTVSDSFLQFLEEIINGSANYSKIEEFYRKLDENFRQIVHKVCFWIPKCNIFWCGLVHGALLW